MQSKSIKICTSVQVCICQAHFQSNTRTKTLCCAIMTDCEPKVARRAFGAPLAGQPTPALGAPLWHVHTFTAKSKCMKVRNIVVSVSSHMRQAIVTSHLQTTHNQAHTRTSTLGSLAIDCEPSVTPHTLLCTNGRTTRARLPHSVFAHARVTSYAIERH